MFEITYIGWGVINDHCTIECFKFVMTVFDLIHISLNFYFGCMLMGKDIRMNVSDSPVSHYFLLVTYIPR
jgi:hypothetical protein